MNNSGLYSLILGIIAYSCFSMIYIETPAILNSVGNDVRPFYFIVGGVCILSAGILLGEGKK